MKRLITAFCILCTFSAVNTVFAASATLTTASTSIANTSGTNGGPALTYTPSPNVSVGVYTTVNAYALTATNTLTDATNGMVYGTTNTSTGYAQRQKTAADVTTFPVPTAVTLPGTAASWNWMGGS